MKKTSAKPFFDYHTFRKVEVVQHFNYANYRRFFCNCPSNDTNRLSPFVDFFMLSLKDSKYVTQKMNEKLFDQIPIKEYQQKLNNFSTNL
jgi:hypothetical protein